MKSFFSEGPIEGPVASSDDRFEPSIYSRARVAVYDSLASAPYVEDLEAGSPREFVERLSVRVHELARDRGSDVPYTVVREVVENFIHADFAEPVVSILDSGNTIRFSDQGPGIPDKARALQPGFTTASGDMKLVIRGVGSGLPIVKEFLSVTGGRLLIEDNLDGGSVVSISCSSRRDEARPAAPLPILEARPGQPTTSSSGARAVTDSTGAPDLFSAQVSAGSVPHVRLTTRQKHVLALVLESGSAGPSIVSRELGVGLSTAYRDLASLEDLGLISSDGGKRTLTAAGMSYLDDVTSSVSST